MNISGWLKPMFGDRKSHLITKPGLLAKTKCGLYLNSRFLQYPTGEQCSKCSDLDLEKLRPLPKAERERLVNGAWK